MKGHNINAMDGAKNGNTIPEKRIMYQKSWKKKKAKKPDVEKEGAGFWEDKSNLSSGVPRNSSTRGREPTSAPPPNNFFRFGAFSCSLVYILPSL